MFLFRPNSFSGLSYTKREVREEMGCLLAIQYLESEKISKKNEALGQNSTLLYVELLLIMKIL